MRLDDVLKIIDNLDEADKQALLEHLQRGQAEHKPRTVPVLNLHPGAMTPSDDFDAELPDSFWLGEE